MGNETMTETAEIQFGVKYILSELRWVDELLAEQIKPLPEPTEEFEHLAEIRRGLECVRSELIDDAIETLDRLASSDEDRLLRAFEERQDLLASVSDAELPGRPTSAAQEAVFEVAIELARQEKRLAEIVSAIQPGDDEPPGDDELASVEIELSSRIEAVKTDYLRQGFAVLMAAAQLTDRGVEDRSCT